MQKKTFELPAMYGDHHVLEIRRILMEVPGVKEVYASSAFHVVEVKFDEKKASDKELQKKLEEAGYTGDLPVVTETGRAVNSEEGEKTFFRHTATYAQTKRLIGFTQQTGYSGRALWPCPGMGVIKAMDE